MISLHVQSAYLIERGDSEQGIARAQGVVEEAEGPVQTGCPLGPARVILEQDRGAGPARPELEARAHLRALDRVPARDGHERTYRRRATSSNGLRSVRRTRSSGERDCGPGDRLG
jgi:hypothetical protein